MLFWTLGLKGMNVLMRTKGKNLWNWICFKNVWYMLHVTTGALTSHFFLSMRKAKPSDAAQGPSAEQFWNSLPRLPLTNHHKMWGKEGQIVIPPHFKRELLTLEDHIGLRRINLQWWNFEHKVRENYMMFNYRHITESGRPFGRQKKT